MERKKQRMLLIYFLHVSLLIWKEGLAEHYCVSGIATPLQPSSTPNRRRIMAQNPSSVFNVVSHRLRERLRYCGTQRFQVCAEAEPHCEWHKDVCVCAWDWARPKQITQTKEESRRHQMNGVFLFLLYKRQTDGLTELEARWIFWSFRNAATVLRWRRSVIRQEKWNLVSVC